MMEGPMDHFVRLDGLPDGYEIPQSLADKLFFDPEGHRLVFRGYMSKTEFDRICEPTRDWGFRRSVEDLFLKSVKDADPAPGGKNRVFGILGRLLPRG
jgi:hypothetical protein